MESHYLSYDSKTKIFSKDEFSLQSNACLKAPNFLNQIYEISIIEYLHQKFSLSGTFIDIGAHIGFYSVGLCKNFRQVIAFEPSKFQFEYLSQNKIESGLSNLSLHNCALGDMHQKLILKVMGRYGGTNTLRDVNYSQTPPMEEYEVDVKILDSYNFKDVDLIKIDVEGFEEKVIKGSIETISNFKPLIVMELWDETENKINTIKLLEGLDYHYETPFEEHPEMFIFEKSLPI